LQNLKAKKHGQLRGCQLRRKEILLARGRVRVSKIETWLHSNGNDPAEPRPVSPPSTAESRGTPSLSELTFHKEKPVAASRVQTATNQPNGLFPDVRLSKQSVLRTFPERRIDGPDVAVENHSDMVG
jgi:hypothetical protein